MDNYLLSGHILVCKIIPDDQIHPKLWVGANRKFRVVPKGRQQNAKRNAVSARLAVVSLSLTLSDTVVYLQTAEDRGEEGIDQEASVDA